MSPIVKFGAIFWLVLWVAPGAAAAQQTDLPPSAPTLRMVEREGHRDILVSTKLADYLFSTQGGVLRSVYVYFAPIGVPPAELIPETETRIDPTSRELVRSYVRGALFPFRLLVNAKPTDDLEYVFESEQFDDKLYLHFTVDVEGVRISKTFIVTENPYYTVEFQLDLVNPTGASMTLDQGVQLILGYGVGRPTGTLAQARYFFGERITDRPAMGRSCRWRGHPRARRPGWESSLRLSRLKREKRERSPTNSMPGGRSIRCSSTWA